MPTLDEWKHLLRGHGLSDREVEQYVKELRSFLAQFLDDYFRDEFLTDEV